MNKIEAEAIAEDSSRNRRYLTPGTTCGCFHCLQTFAATDIIAWVDDDTTALCPLCGIDAVLPGITDAETLRSLHHHRFEATVSRVKGLEKIRAAGE